MTPIYIKGHDECLKHYKVGFEQNEPAAWKCTDFQHPSFIDEHVAENMFWNYVCNDIMNFGGKLCCTD